MQKPARWQGQSAQDLCHETKRAKHATITLATGEAEGTTCSCHGTQTAAYETRDIDLIPKVTLLELDVMQTQNVGEFFLERLFGVVRFLVPDIFANRPGH
jgi:hypothetical protein